MTAHKPAYVAGTARSSLVPSEVWGAREANENELLKQVTHDLLAMTAFACVPLIRRKMMGVWMKRMTGQKPRTLLPREVAAVQWVRSC